MEIVEQDTIDSEEIQDLAGFLLPNGHLTLEHALFGLSYNKRTLDGWVKQPSACCAAAAVAGAWNAITGHHRLDKQALHHNDVLAVYRTIFEQLIEKKKSAFERKLGSQIDTLLEDIDGGLRAVGREIGGKKGCGPTRVIVRRIVERRCIQHHQESRAAQGSDRKENEKEDDMHVGPLDCLVVLLEKDGFSFESQDTDVTAADTKEGEAKDSDEEAGSDEEEGEAAAFTIPANGKTTAMRGKSTPWDWRKDLYTIIQHKAGLSKLCAERPSTAAVGNWGLLEVVQRLSVGHGLGSQVSARLFMGKRKTAKSKVEVALSRKDSEETVRSQWEALRSMVMRPNEAVVFHLKNHYALVFACREWVQQGDGQCVRQLLTARKGQRPTAWMDFAEAREVMLGWEGYKMIAVSSSLPTEELRRAMGEMTFDS